LKPVKSSSCSQTNVSASNTYRDELDGLRALAIISVLIFHLSPQDLPGGFLGVDVFFVLSGYLITSQILPRIKKLNPNKQFSLVGFYLRRIKRLWPAICFLLLSLNIFSFFILYTGEWESLSSQSMAMLGLFSNHYYKSQAGLYWGPGAENMILLHAWSLSIEEQFYIFYPLFLVLVSRNRQHRLKFFISILVISVVSFSAFSYAMKHHPVAGFYLAPLRAWELLAGSLITTFPHMSMRPSLKIMPQLVDGLPFLGLLLLLIGFLTGWGSDSLSVKNSTITVFATCFFILFSSDSSRPIRMFFSNFIMIKVGKLSYSLYLWHWPVIILCKYAGLESWLYMVAITVLFAWFSFTFIENTLRYVTNKNFFMLFSVLLLFTFSSLSLPYWLKRNHITYEVPKLQKDPNSTYKYYKNKKTNIVFLGDSHGQMYQPAIEKSSVELGLNTKILLASGTSPLFVDDEDHVRDYIGSAKLSASERLQYDIFRKSTINKLKPSLIILSGRWDSYWSKFRGDRLMNNLRNIKESFDKTNIIILGQPPVLPFGSDTFISGTLDAPPLRSTKEFSLIKRRREEMHHYLKKFCKENSNCHFLDTEHIFYSDRGLRYYEDGKLFYWDDDHLSIDGAYQVYPFIKRLIYSTIKG
jgi:peptidoglycan/LPS O-acetylase OafA/YrhL